MSYRVLRKLTDGGFAEVFEVEDTASALPEQLVLKRLSAEMSARADVRAAFADEAKILRELKHPNVVTFRRCYFDEEQRVCLLMEKVNGEPLDTWSGRHLAQPQTVLDVFERVVQAVDYLHRRPVPFFHLDLKPDNILVSNSGEGTQPVLIDFGIARRSGGKGLKAYTPPYGAPEQQAGGALGPPTDVHALGQILSELLESLPAIASPIREALLEVAARAKSQASRARFLDAGELGLAFRRARKPASTELGADWFFRRWHYAVGGVALGALVLAGAVLIKEASPPSRQAVAPQGRPSRPEFDRLISQVREAIDQGDYKIADDRYKQAEILMKSLPPATTEAKLMKSELDSLLEGINSHSQGGSPDSSIFLDGQ